MKLTLPKKATTYTDTPIVFTVVQVAAAAVASWAAKAAVKKAFGIEPETVKYKPKA